MKFTTSNKVYAHIDCNSFFVSCEVYRNPNLKGKYVCVGNEIILAASYEAKKLGIKTGTPIWEARKILGSKAIFLNSDLNFYKTISKRFTNFLNEFSNDVQVFSIDEAFLDITGMAELSKMDYLDFAIFLKNEIKKCVGIPVSVGISNTKLKAKIFSDINKPFGEFVSFCDNATSNIFKSLKVTDTPFIGVKTGEKIKYICKTINDFRILPFWKVDELLGKNGTDIWLELNGVDIMDFTEKVVPKSISRTSSFNNNITNDKDFLWHQTVINFNKAYSELIRNNLELKNISLYLRDSDMKKYFYDYKFEDFTSIRKDLLLKIKELFFSLIDFSLSYRTTGIFLSNFNNFTPKQLSTDDLTNMNFNKNINLNKAIDFINKKYAKKIVNFGI